MGPKAIDQISVQGGDLIPRKDYPIGPGHIDSVRIGDVLGRRETEMACAAIVKGCQERAEGWAPFTLEDVDLHEDHSGLVDLLERGLVRGWEDNSEVGKSDTFMVSHDLVALLFANAPAWIFVSTSGIDGD